jgi:hypothetical protein
MLTPPSLLPWLPRCCRFAAVAIAAATAMAAAVTATTSTVSAALLPLFG